MQTRQQDRSGHSRELATQQKMSRGKRCGPMEWEDAGQSGFVLVLVDAFTPGDADARESRRLAGKPHQMRGYRDAET